MLTQATLNNSRCNEKGASNGALFYYLKRSINARQTTIELHKPL